MFSSQKERKTLEEVKGLIIKPNMRMRGINEETNYPTYQLLDPGSGIRKNVSNVVFN